MAIDLVRNGSRGMSWLEPLVEVEVDGEKYVILKESDVLAIVEG